MIETISLGGVTISLYYLFWVLGLLSAIMIGVFLRKVYSFSLTQCVLFVLLDFLVGYPLIWAISWVFGGGQVNGFNVVRLMTIAPVYIFLISKFAKIPYEKLSDYLAPIGMIFIGVSHIGCIFLGCCHGYPSTWGLFSNVSNTICFPIQPIEALTNITIGLVLFFMAQKRIQSGKLFAWSMIAFGGTRFLLEFFRDNEKIVGNISELAFHALGSLLVGLLLLIIPYCLKRRRTNEE